MKEANKNIPQHWEMKKLGEVCKLINGYAFKSSDYINEGIPVIRISDINKGIVSIEDTVRVKAKSDYENYLIEKNDILVAMSGATTGKFGIYKSSEKAYQNQRVGKFKILNTDILDNQFLFHQINSLKRQIEKAAYGGAQPNISSTKIEQMLLTIPPLPEQVAIVNKIEELFSELENGKEQLLTAQRQLKIYRQSLLKAAFGSGFSGLMDEQDSTNKSDNSKSENLENYRNSDSKSLPNTKSRKSLNPANPDADKDLPEGWKWVKLGDYSNLITKGASPRWQGFEYISDRTQLLFVTSGNVRENYIDIDNPKYLKLEFNNIQKRSILQKGDVLFNLVGASIGRAAIFNLEIITNINQAVAIIRLKETLNNKYVSFFLNSEIAKHKYLSNIVDVARANISLTDTSNIQIPLPPLPVQQAIVSILESKLTVCDKLEETISHSLQQTAILRQSILKKAFEGKLV